MSAPQLGIDPEDLGFDLLPAVEKSFGISFNQDDFHENYTYGELHELVCAKLPTATAADCTTQQAFYKLRQALRPLVGTTEIRPGTLLADLLPPAQRREAAVYLDAALGMELTLVSMPVWAILVGSLLILASLLTFFFNWLLALEGLALAITGLAVAYNRRKQLQYRTVREVVEQMSSRYYRQSRRNPNTVNPREIAAQLKQIFTEMACLQAVELVPHAVL